MSRAIRVLHVLTLVDDESSYGGPTTVAVSHCTQLRQLGIDARIAAGWRGAGRPPAEIEGVPSHLFPVRVGIPAGRFSGLVAPGLTRWLSSNASAFDFAHVHLARDLVPLLAARQLRQAGVPYVTQTHGMVMPDRRRSARALDRLLTLPALRGALARFVLTTREQAGLRDLLGTEVPTEFLPNGFAVPTGVAVREPEPPDVLFLARLHPRKRVLDFARAAVTLLNEKTEATFSIVGPDDGDLKALRALLSERPDLADRLRYEGALPHDAAVARMARCSVYALPSVDEPFPMTLLEALALGRPSICTTTCGIAERLSSRRAAVVVEAGPGPLTEALRHLLEDVESRRSLGQQAEKTAREEFAIEAVVERVLRRAGAWVG